MQLPTDHPLSSRDAGGEKGAHTVFSPVPLQQQEAEAESLPAGQPHAQGDQESPGAVMPSGVAPL